MESLNSEKNEKYLDMSIRLGQKALSLAPGNVLAHIALGGAYLKKERSDETIKFLERALKLNPAGADLENIYHYLGQAYCAKGLFDQSVICFNKMTKQKFKLARPYFMMGVLSCEKGDYNRAVSFYQEVIKIDPRYYYVHSALGAAYVFLGKYREATKSFSKNMEINGRNINDICGTGVCLLAVHAYTKVVSYLTEALTRDEISCASLDDTHYSRQIGKSVSRAIYGSTDKSLERHQWTAKLLVISAFEKVISIKFEKKMNLNSHQVLPLFLIATAYMGLGKHDMAKEVCQKIIECGGETEASFFLKQCLALEKRPLKETEIYKKALERNNKDIEAALKLTRIYLAKKQFDLALAYGQMALEIAPDNSLANFHVGFLYFKNGWCHAALALLEKSVKLDNSNAQACFFLGETFLAVDNRASARQIFEKTVQLDADGQWGRKAGLKLEEK